MRASAIHFYILLLFSSLFVSPLMLIAETLKLEPFRFPPNHNSHYSIEKYGIRVGDMTNNFYLKDESISYKSIAKAKGIAAHFFNANPIESSGLSWPISQRHFMPQQTSYYYIQSEKHKNNQHIAFNWSGDKRLTIKGEYRDKHYQLQTQQIVWSRQLLPILMSSDLQLKPTMTHNSFYIVDKGKINKYTYTLQKHEELIFNQATLDTLQFKITQDGSSNETLVWLSEKYFYLPLKIEQFDDGDLNMSMIMTQFSLRSFIN